MTWPPKALERPACRTGCSPLTTRSPTHEVHLRAAPVTSPVVDVDPVPVRDDVRALAGTTRRGSTSPFGSTSTSRRTRRPTAGATSSRPRSPTSSGTAIRTGRRTSCGRRSPTGTVSRPTRSSPPTGRTRCCRRSCWRTAGRIAPPSRSSRRTNCTAHIARITGHDRRGGRAGRRLHARPGRRPGRDRSDAAGGHVPLLAEQPDRSRRAALPSSAPFSTPRPGWWSSTRRTPSSPTGPRSSSSTTTSRWSSCARSPRRGAWPRTRLGYLVGPRWVVDGVGETSSCRTTSTRRSSSPGGSPSVTSPRWTRG